MGDRPEMLIALLIVVAIRVAACTAALIMVWKLRDVGRVWVVGHALVLAGMLFSLDEVGRGMAELETDHSVVRTLELCFWPVVSSVFLLLGEFWICRGVLQIAAHGTESLELLKQANDHAFKTGTARWRKIVKRRDDKGQVP